MTFASVTVVPSGPRGVRCRGDLALHELDEAADAVRLVHDVVAGLQLQRIDDVLAAARELLDLARVDAGASARRTRTRRAAASFSAGSWKPASTEPISR